MPPKAAARLPSRAASREPDSTPATRSASFLKPNLPPLQGTPSSRRQYSYGAAAEPPPARPGRGLLRGQVLDLSTAVRHALTRRDDDELEDDVASVSRMPSRSVDPYEDDDELAAGSEVASNAGARQLRGPAKPLRDKQLGGQLADDSEADDARSFGLESDFYGDATIASTPGAMPPPQSRPTRRREPRRPQNPAAETSSDSQYEPETSGSASQAAQPPLLQRRGRSKKAVQPNQDDQDVKPIILRHEGQTNTPAPKPATTRAGRAAQASRPESEATAAAGATRSTRSRRGQQAGGQQSLVVNKTQEGGGLGAGAPEHDNGSEPGRWLIGATRATAATDNARRAAGSSLDQGSRTDNEELDGAGPGINWWQLLNPWTYVEATAWIVEATGAWLSGLFDAILSAKTRHRLVSAFHALPYIMAGVTALVLALALSSAAVASVRNGAAGGSWKPQASGAMWRSMGGITSKMGGYLPAISWSSPVSWDDVADLWDADDGQHGKIDGFLKKMEKAFRSLETTGKLHDASLRKLEMVVPKIVHMQLKDGKPQVALDFWHALRDLIRGDGGFLTLDGKGSEHDATSERQWKAAAARLAGDPAFTSKLNLSVGDVEGRLGNRIAGLWETWVKENEAKIEKVVGSAVDQVKSAASQRELDERVGKLIQAQLKDRERHGLLVGRDEFLRHVKEEVAAHRSEIRAELGELQPRLDKLVRESVGLAMRDAPPGMSRADVTTLVNGLVRKAFADVGLEAMARGKIHDHWHTELKNQVNYFSVGAGAVINKHRTSVVWEPKERSYFPWTRSPDETADSLRAPLPALVALGPWQDEGECWCAGRSRNRRGNPHGAMLAVLLGYSVVPQHVVLEHILPGATTDPGARPRDVEVYAEMADEATRERVRDFAAAHFPDDTADWNYAPANLPDSFVKIGQFVYEGAEQHDGVHVHRLSSELVALGAATDSVVVRAVSNYGASDHTCFYRVRLYGHNVDLEDAVDPDGVGEV